MMMPVFGGAPWVPKFDGTAQGSKYSEWKQQITGLITAATYDENQAVSLLLGALQGEAKREILVLSETERDKASKIFAVLTKVYGDQVPLSVLRSKFFSCRQQANETLRTFALRLRELHRRIQGRSEEEAPPDCQLRDQLLLGLREGSLCRALKTYVRRNPDEPFAAVFKEALLLEEEHQQIETEEAACALIGESNATQSRSQEKHWKQTLKEEILGDLKAQLKELTQELWKECQPAPAHLRADPPGGRQSYGRRRAQSQSRFNWDAEGKPICHRCGLAGHIGRYCRSRSESQPPLNE